MFPPGDRENQLDDDEDAAPDPARERLAVAPEDLAPERGGVSAGDAVGDDAEGDDDGAEAAKAVQGRVAFDDEGAGRGAVCSDQAALDVMPVPKPMPRRNTRVNESQRPVRVRKKTFTLDVRSG